MEMVKKLLTVKSLVTLTLTGVFAYVSLSGQISTEFLTIYTTVIAFYFGTQHEKERGQNDRATDNQV